MKRGHIADAVAEASHPAPGRAVTADPAVLAARTIAGVDIGAARRAAADFLSALGIDVDREDLRETPARMARAYAELFSTLPLRLTTFANDEGYDELVLARALPFRTVCEHHLLPFSGLAHVGYLPGERIVGLSKLARLVEHFAARPQVQERLTKQVAECLAARLRARGVGVVLEAEHSCMTLRGVRARRQDRYVFDETIQACDGVDVVIHAAARMILAAVASYGLQAFDALQRVNARGTFVVNQQAPLQLRDGARS